MGPGKNFRLSEDVRPTRYRADLAPDLEQGRFEGRMDIELALARSRREIVLHGIELQINRAELRAAGKLLAAERIEPDAERRQQAISDKTPRNAPCPCGSGKKYKKCHGAAA